MGRALHTWHGGRSARGLCRGIEFSLTALQVIFDLDICVLVTTDYYFYSWGFFTTWSTDYPHVKTFRPEPSCEAASLKVLFYIRPG
jgi:hypothetical protein